MPRGTDPHPPEERGGEIPHHAQHSHRMSRGAVCKGLRLSKQPTAFYRCRAWTTDSAWRYDHLLRNLGGVRSARGCVPRHEEPPQLVAERGFARRGNGEIPPLHDRAQVTS